MQSRFKPSDDVLNCSQCSIGISWPPLHTLHCWCDWTWVRRAMGWSKSKKGLWYCQTCWPPEGAQGRMAMDSICGSCKELAIKGIGLQAVQRSQIAQQAAAPQWAPQWHAKLAASVPVTTKPPMKSLQKSDVYDSARDIRDAILRERAGAAVNANGASAERQSSSSSSTSSSRSRSRKRKKRKKRKRSSSSSSRRSSSSGSVAAVAAAGNGGAGPAQSAALEAAKADALKELLELKKIQDASERNKQFRALLRAWHPDKNPERSEVATAVFQFLQKGKNLLQG